ncbi:unnamed protein product [Didymodactylos carnosus]|uniref:NHL repeat-containing protein n=1 Tax=Didymodactylos carnosus TaxID=1234261 RepID=A0A815Q065_9BILA|nr:unnamed protein product [Didymodactylos carnosus]CAF1456436.1 unnamed protein product [Didymodactylos carnosus]CAF3958741.1 unnamed protein product [Didymodactylos carnosus]CAF4328142.1 unnamed protein product [Didymodactylos carnosus]
MPSRLRTAPLWQEEMDVAVGSINSIAHSVCMLMKIKQSTSLTGGITAQGDRLDQLNEPHFLFVDRDHLYVSDDHNHRVMKWLKSAKEGVVVAGGRGEGDALTQLHWSNGVIVDQLGTVYVVDLGNHRIMCWPQEAKQGTIIVGGNGLGNQANQLIYPTGLSLDRQNNFYVAEMNNHRVQRFSMN